MDEEGLSFLRSELERRGLRDEDESREDESSRDVLLHVEALDDEEKELKESTDRCDLVVETEERRLCWDGLRSTWTGSGHAVRLIHV